MVCVCVYVCAHGDARDNNEEVQREDGLTPYLLLCSDDTITIMVPASNQTKAGDALWVLCA